MQATHSSISDGGSCARDQPGVLCSSQHLPSVQTIPLLFHGHQLVWLGSLDLLEHSKQPPLCTLCSCSALHQPVHISPCCAQCDAHCMMHPIGCIVTLSMSGSPGAWRPLSPVPVTCIAIGHTPNNWCRKFWKVQLGPHAIEALYLTLVSWRVKRRNCLGQHQSNTLSTPSRSCSCCSWFMHMGGIWWNGSQSPNQ